MNKFIIFAIFSALVAMIAIMESAMAGPTRVGNGDDGGDLESAITVKSGILLETRAEAVALLKQLNVSGISGLGQLIPETEKTELLLVDRNVNLSMTQASPEERSDALEEARAIGAVNEKNQPVYARTFPEPHAATRFFPAALMLDRKQLIALHIHEALHRSLPASVRENEQAVSRVTLAITSSGATNDRIKDVVTREVQRATALGAAASSQTKADSETASVSRSSIVEYGYRSFFLPDAQRAQTPMSSFHSLKSFLYPFESDSFGFGVEFTFVVLPERSYLGPVGLASEYKVGMWGRSDIKIFGELHMNTLSDGEVKNTPVGRDTATMGVRIHREAKSFKLVNLLYFTAASDATQKIGGVEYTHKFGAVFGARVSALGRTTLTANTLFEWGGMAEVLLANSHEVQGGGNTTKTGRLRVVSVGPELAYTSGEFRYSLNGRFVIDSTQGISLDQVGDLMGHGVGQGSWGGAVSWAF